MKVKVDVSRLTLLDWKEISANSISEYMYLSDFLTKKKLKKLLVQSQEIGNFTLEENQQTRKDVDKIIERGNKILQDKLKKLKDELKELKNEL